MNRTELTRVLASLTDDEFVELTTEARGAGKGNVIPSVGAIPATQPNPIRTAEAEGDWVTARALKAQQLVELARHQR